MCRRFAGTAVTSLALLLACAKEPAGPHVGALAALADPLSSKAGTSVEVKSEHLTGTLPIGLVVDVNLKVDAEGETPGSLSGPGRHFASTGAHNYWTASGSTDGTTITLGGSVNESNTAFLIGSPVSVTADVVTQAITLTFGPLAGGPFAGQILVFTGSGNVSITSTP